MATRWRMLDVPHVRERAGAGWLDLGAGAGIPGIPLAVALARRRADAARLGVAQVRVPRGGRGRSRPRGRAHVVCARSEQYAAVRPAARSGGRAGARRGAAAGARGAGRAAARARRRPPGQQDRGGRAREGAAGEVAAGLCGLAAGPVVALPRSPLDEAVCAVYEKVAPTPDRFPRREGLAAKRPLAT